MWRFVAVLVHLRTLADAGDCSVGTTSVQLIKQKGYDLTGQTHVITGGDSGIGLGIATALMEANARVVFLAHNLERTNSAVRSIESRTGNGNFRIIPVDLLSLNSTMNAAKALMDEQQVNVFIGDAGSVMLPSFVTHDGFESMFQLDYLSHFYLVQHLLPKLRESHGRIIFTGSDGISPFDKTSGLCAQLSEAQGCEAIDRIAARINRVVPSPVFFHYNGNVFLGLYLKVMLARQVALSETNVTAFSFHPGWVATPAETGFVEKFGEWLLVWFLGLAGLVLGCLTGCLLCCKGKGRYNIVYLCVAFFLALVLGICFGCLFGYLFAGNWVLVQYCGITPYWVCLCNDPDGTAATKTCPMSPLEGGLGGAYLAAANASEIANVNGAVTVLCGTHPTNLAFDPYVGMVNKVGKSATRDYLKTLHNQSQQWINEASGGNSQSNFVEAGSDRIGIGRRDQILTLSGVGLVASFLCVMAPISRARRGVAHKGASEALLAAREMRA